MDDPGCPLHASTSDHGDTPEADPRGARIEALEEALRAVRRGDPAESLAILADGSGHEEAAEAAEGTEP